MHDQADTGGDVVELHAIARQRLGHLGRQLPVGRRGMDTDLLEQPAAGEKAAGAAAAAGAACPRLERENRGIARERAPQAPPVPAPPPRRRCGRAAIRTRSWPVPDVVRQGLSCRRLMVSNSGMTAVLSERSAAQQLIAALQACEQIDHPDQAILDRFCPNPPERVARRRRGDRLDQEYGSRRAGPSAAGFLAGAHSLPGNASIRAATASFRFDETTARREIESSPPRSSSRPISA